MPNYTRIERHHLKDWLGILPGWSWLQQHEHDLDDWKPTVELSTGGSHYIIHVNYRRYLMGNQPPRDEQFNARWRKYLCRECSNIFEIFTVSPVPPERRICYCCQRQPISLKAYANALGAVIANGKGE